MLFFESMAIAADGTAAVGWNEHRRHRVARSSARVTVKPGRMTTFLRSCRLVSPSGSAQAEAALRKSGGELTRELEVTQARLRALGGEM